MINKTAMKPYAALFPGQGAQSVGMMSSFAQETIVRHTFSEAQHILGVDFWSEQERGPAEALAKTTLTQPLLLTAGVAVYRLWQQKGAVMPQVSAGHSLGEYCALVAAMAMDFSVALKVVKARAELMEAAAEHGVGAMAAVLNATIELIEACCQEASAEDESVEPVNYNTPEQIVIAGHRPAVERAINALKEKGVKRAILLPVGGAFHSRLMDSAAQGMRQVLADVPIKPPIFPVIHNATLTAHNHPDEIREALAKQVSAPVKWVETIHHIQTMGVNVGVECAPGKVLAGLNRRINPDMGFYSLSEPNAVASALESMQ